jgi:hypothetical protein
MEHRLRRGLEHFAHGTDVRVILRSFQPHPDLPCDGVRQRAAELFAADVPAVEVAQRLEVSTMTRPKRSASPEVTPSTMLSASER